VVLVNYEQYPTSAYVKSCKLKRVIFYDADPSRVAPRAVKGAELSAATRAPIESFLGKISTVSTSLAR
jgi:hypothetical protein